MPGGTPASSSPGSGESRERSPLTFFLLVFALSAPFWLLGAMTDRQLMPGLSVSALMAFCPMVAALILVHREDSAAGVPRLLRRSFDFKRIKDKRWLAPTLLVMPGVSVVVYGLMRWMGLPVPAPQFSWLAALLMFFAFFVGALGEELGWSGYALDPLQDRWTALTASLVLGVVGILWHIVPLVLLNRSPTWIAWWSLYAVAARVLMVWLFNNTGKSVFAVALFHATLNLSYMLFPVSGSHFDMRLGSLVLAFVAVVVVLWGPKTPHHRGLPWTRLLATGAVGIALAHLLVEGPRWQMAPAYGLTGMLLLISLREDGVTKARLAGRKVVKRITVGLGALGLVVSVALPLAIPVFGFPQPTGPYAIGTLTYVWSDEARSELFNVDPEVRRKLVVQIWYPAQSHPSGVRAAYMPDAAAVMTAFARIHQLPAFVFGHFSYVTTNARLSAPAATGQRSYPVLLFLEGATGYRQMNTYQVEALVSHGYIVAAIDQPGVAANVIFPDGHQSPGLTMTQFQSVVRPSYLPAVETPALGATLPNGRRLNDTSIIPYLAKDAIFTLDRLTALNQADPNGILTSKLDLQQVGAFGLSLGGIVVGEVCRLDPRVRACLVMDAPMSIDVVRAGLRQPSMWITRDAASMRLERQRTGGWPDAEIEAHQATMYSVFQGLSGAGYFVRVPGMFHSNFTDIPSWSPAASWWGLTGPINGQRAHDLVNAYSLAFFDQHLMGRSTVLLDGSANHGPDVLFESRGP